MSAERLPVVLPGHEETYAQWHLPAAVRVGATVHCSGVLGTRDDGTVPEELAEEIDLAFRNLAAVLEAAGASLADVADLLTFHLDLAGQVPAFMKVRDQHLAEPWPAWTAVGAAQLGGGLPGVRLEIKATAYLNPEKHPTAGGKS